LIGRVALWICHKASGEIRWPFCWLERAFKGRCNRVSGGMKRAKAMPFSQTGLSIKYIANANRVENRDVGLHYTGQKGPKMALHLPPLKGRFLR
jgi:hypothetical protein